MNALCRRILGLTCVLVSGTIMPALADMEADKAAISDRLLRWAEAVNERDPAAACSLFAADLVASVDGLPDRDRAAVCSHLAAALAAPDKRLKYAPDIREIIISGNLAVVRVVWTLITTQGSNTHTSEEKGIDVFRRQPDGSWAITRFLAVSIDRG